MPHEHKEEAQRRLGNLVALLRSQPDSAAYREAIEVAEHLERAIAAFHLEAIRFRMFTLARLLQRPGLAAPEAVRAGLDQVRASLEAAGFHTRSVST